MIYFITKQSRFICCQCIVFKIFEGNSELDSEVICFHLRQSAEKMKAILSKNQIYYPKIHDLEALVNLLTENIDMHTNHDLLVELNDYAVEGRYAVMHEELESIKEIFTLVTDMQLRPIK